MKSFILQLHKNLHFDPMLQSLYKGLDQNIFTIDKLPDPVFYIDDIKQYNLKEGLALNDDEIEYLDKLSIVNWTKIN